MSRRLVRLGFLFNALAALAAGAADASAQSSAAAVPTFAEPGISARS